MVIIFKKTLEKKGADDVTSKSTDSLQAPTMSQGTALFSCGLMESGLWRGGGHGCSLQPRPVGTSLESLWDVLPEMQRSSGHWDWDSSGGGGGGSSTSTSSAISSLLQELQLSDSASSHSTAPPSKRQCRSLSCSDDLGSFRSAWRPQGSRVWTAVEKRRCHSGGSVQRGGGGGVGGVGGVAMQRSSSFSLPSRCNALEPPSFAFHALTPSSSMPLPSELAPPPPPPLYLSHEQICLQGEPPQGASPLSSPDSTPELERRSGGGGQGGLPRSRSQPCVLNDKKIGVKRRRPADSHKQRPSLDLNKMTQKLRNFHSLSCLGVTSEDVCEADQGLLTSRGWRSHHRPHAAAEDVQPRTKESVVPDPAIEEAEWSSAPDFADGTSRPTNGKEGEPLWAGLCGVRKDVYQLGGELDIEQIERN